MMSSMQVSGRTKESVTQIVNGRLGEMENICVTHAIITFKQRRQIDTNPQIVRMVHLGESLDHWYYRSEEWIDQPYYFRHRNIQPYVGPAHLAMPILYGKRTYLLDEDLMHSISDEEILAQFPG